jgi:hypothetical protein
LLGVNRWLSIFLLGVASAASTARAQAVVSWGASTAISADENVVTVGALVASGNLGGAGVAAVTLNGVVFAAFAFPSGSSNTATLGQATFVVSTGALNAATSLGSGTAPFASLSADYRTLLTTGGTLTGGGPLTLTLSGLTAGHDYVFQWWSNDSTGGFSSSIASDGLGHALVLNGGLGPDGYVGRFGLGSFTAAGAFQDFSFTGNDSFPLINAFQLRDVTAIPEPMPVALVAGALVLAAGIARRKSVRPKA